MPLGGGGLTEGNAARIEQFDVHMQGYSRGNSQFADRAHSLAEGQGLAGLHPTLASNREAVRHVLDEAFYMLTDESIFLRIEIERVIISLCKRTLLMLLGCDNQDGRAYVLENVVRIKNCILTLKVRPDLQFDQLLHFILQDPKSPHLDSPGDYLHTEVWLTDSVGHYQGIRVTLPTHLSSSMCDQITQQIADGFTAGYLWLNERIRFALNHLGGTFECDSLQLLRRQFLIQGCADLAHQLWLVKVADGRVT